MTATITRTREANKAERNGDRSIHDNPRSRVVPGTPTPEVPTRRITCRYTNRLGDLCTGEAVDPEGEILLCIKHLGRALELFRRRAGGK